jgi:hypothetical protein
LGRMKRARPCPRGAAPSAALGLVSVLARFAGSRAPAAASRVKEERPQRSEDVRP